jgi:hypothetical protein
MGLGLGLGALWLQHTSAQRARARLGPPSQAQVQTMATAPRPALPACHCHLAQLPTVCNTCAGSQGQPPSARARPLDSRVSGRPAHGHHGHAGSCFAALPLAPGPAPGANPSNWPLTHSTQCPGPAPRAPRQRARDPQGRPPAPFVGQGQFCTSPAVQGVGRWTGHPRCHVMYCSCTASSK